MTLSPRERAAQKVNAKREQEQLLQELLGVLDALDHACEHWQQAQQSQAQSQLETDGVSSVIPETPLTLPRPTQTRQRRLRTWLGQRLLLVTQLVTAEDTQTETNSDATTESMTEVLTSAHEGVEMIRRSLLDILEQRQVTPINAVGKPFNPAHMRALGRETTEQVPDNTVIQEVVRGYHWQQKILREAQVIVAVQPQTPTEPDVQ